MTLGKSILIKLKCGHTIVRDALQTLEMQVVASDGKTPFGYQYSPTGKFVDDLGEEHIDTVHFLEAADCNGLCLHEMGLGKTIIECILLARNPQLLPALLVVKSGLRAQWFLEVYKWTGIIAQIITSSKELPYLDTFPIVIVSVDT